MPAYALIAEADPGSAELYRTLISAEGVDLELVRDGAAAREVMARRGPPALLLCDLSLPKVDGFTLLAEVRAQASAAQVPAIAVSGFLELRELAGRLREQLGLSAVLPKPAPIDTLRRVIKRGLSVNFSMRSTAPGYKLPGPALQQLTNPRIDLRAMEAARLDAVKRMGLVDDLAPDATLEALLAAATKELGVQAAVVSVALQDRHWFKAQHGLTGTLLEARGVEQSRALFRQVVETGQPLIVPDAASHPLFKDDPLVTSGMLRGFAAAPLNGPEGEVLGALALLDQKPLELGADGLDQLVQLARRVAGELELEAQDTRARRSIRRNDEQKRIDEITADLQESTLLYLEAVLDNIDAAVYLLDGKRRVVFVNRVLAGWLGKEPAALLGETAEELATRCSALFDDPNAFLRRLRVPASGPFAVREEFEVQRPTRRVVRWVTKPVQLPDAVGHLGVVTDVTAEAELLHERQALSRTDSVTGLANRRGGEESIQREVSRSERGGMRLSFALFDVDHFKHLNDSKGTAAGDDALRASARVLLSAVRGADLVIRWGPDELLAVLPQTGLEGARSFAERIRAAIEGREDAQFGKFTVSCGVAELHQGEDEGEALARAEEKLQKAKAAGRNRVL
jgi:diguanylate cyclase (GGDEF)-like protein